MNEVYERNNIYCMFQNNNPNYIYILYLKNAYLYEYKTLCSIGDINNLKNNKEITVIPIDIILYHFKETEHLHKDYDELTTKLRKEGLYRENEYKKTRYFFTYNNLEDLEDTTNTIDINRIKKVLQNYGYNLANFNNTRCLKILNIEGFKLYS